MYKSTTVLKICGNFVQKIKEHMNHIEDIIRNNGGYITANQAKAVNRTTYYKVLELVRNGNLVRIRPGVYLLPDEMAKTMIDVKKVIPGGVLCMYSAWAYYELTTQIPTEYYVAIARNKKVRLPEYPPVTIYRWDEVAYKTGITQANIEGIDVPVYDIEKSVCDAIKHRNKIGIDVSSEILRNYLNRKTRDIDKLMKYAKIMRVASTIKKYLEIQL